MIDTNIIRAYDIRGVVGKTLTPQIMAKFGFLLGKEGEKIVVGNDIRSSGIELAKALISGLLKKKSRVYYSGTGSFGQILLSGMGKNKVLYITASHNPAEWNGLKMYYGNGISLSGEEIERMKKDIIDVEEIPLIDDALKKTEKIESKKSYKKYIKEKFKINKLKVVVDCNFGSTSLVIPEILREMGLDVVSINDKADPEFGGKTPKVDPDCVQELKERVLEEKADLGMVFDGDGDRTAVVDETGRILTGNEIGVLFGKYYIEKSRGTIINTVSCSIVAEKILKPMGAKIITVPVGHTFVGNGCKEHNAIMGYEESGHTFLPEYFYFDDAFIVPLKIMEIMREKEKKLSELVSEIPSYPFSEKSFFASDDKKFKIMENLSEKLKKEYENVNDMDGIKVIFDDGWILIRCSNTGPKIRLYTEALTTERFKELENKFTDILKEAIA